MINRFTRNNDLFTLRKIFLDFSKLAFEISKDDSIEEFMRDVDCILDSLINLKIRLDKKYL